MISSIAHRIGEFIAYKKISRRTFASKLGYTSSEKINRLFRKDGAKPGFDIVADIANKFVEVNVDWLVTGRGEMLKGENDISAHGVSTGIREGLAFIPQKVAETYLEAYDREDFIRQFPVFSFPGLGQGLHRMFEIRDRERLICRQASLEDLTEDRVYVLLIRASGLVTGSVDLSRLAAGEVLLEDGTLVAMDDVLEAWEVIYLVTRHLPGAQERAAKIAELESRVRQMDDRLKQKGI